ncbi:MAG: hypothetical protein ACFB15_27570 [Cyclobacteriaceae bacterium]
MNLLYHFAPMVKEYYRHYDMKGQHRKVYAIKNEVIVAAAVYPVILISYAIAHVLKSELGRSKKIK